MFAPREQQSVTGFQLAAKLMDKTLFEFLAIP
jgi:hypothetical protein